MNRFAATLVFRLPDGSFMHEPFEQEGADSAEALGKVLRDGYGRAFGRELMGLSRFEPAPRGPRAVDDIPTTEVRPTADRIAMDLVPPAPEPPRAFELDALGDVPWWSLEGAFGPASDLGLQLGRAGALDPELARAGAEPKKSNEDTHFSPSPKVGVLVTSSRIALRSVGLCVRG